MHQHLKYTKSKRTDLHTHKRRERLTCGLQQLGSHGNQKQRGQPDGTQKTRVTATFRIHANLRRVLTNTICTCSGEAPPGAGCPLAARALPGTPRPLPSAAGRGSRCTADGPLPEVSVQVHSWQRPPGHQVCEGGVGGACLLCAEASGSIGQSQGNPEWASGSPLSGGGDGGPGGQPPATDADTQSCGAVAWVRH